MKNIILIILTTILISCNSTWTEENKIAFIRSCSIIVEDTFKSNDEKEKYCSCKLESYSKTLNYSVAESIFKETIKENGISKKDICVPFKINFEPPNYYELLKDELDDDLKF
jgi:hypothetical protein|tara:strand:+ start:269 stop:604 length:336 start_codon:yes stop_codon:yes gene_type:complete